MLGLRGVASLAVTVAFCPPPAPSMSSRRATGWSPSASVMATSTAASRALRADGEGAAVSVSDASAMTAGATTASLEDPCDAGWDDACAFKSWACLRFRACSSIALTSRRTACWLMAPSGPPLRKLCARGAAPLAMRGLSSEAGYMYCMYRKAGHPDQGRWGKGHTVVVVTQDGFEHVGTLQGTE